MTSPNRKLYEAWQLDEFEMVFGEAESVRSEIALGEFSETAKLLHQVEAETYERAMALHYLEMGWGEYTPMGEAEECPNGCGSMFYPLGSGECPCCGNIR